MALFNKKKCCLTLLFLAILLPDAAAIYYKLYTTSNALISNNVYHVQRDSKGFMWFATEKGVSKYDGRSFKNFTTLDGIVDYDVFNFYEDKYGRLWLYTYNGNYCYIRNDSVFNAHNDPLLKQMPIISYVNAMWETADTTLYIGYSDGQVLKLKGQQVSWINKQGDHDHIMTIFESGKRLYVLSDHVWSVIQGDSLADVRTISPHRSFYYGGRVLMSDTGGIKVFKGEQQVWKYDDKELTLRNVIHIYCDNKGNVFCSTHGGLVIVNYLTNKKYKVFSNLKVSCVSEDMYGDYWITTMGSGIYCVNKELDQLQYIRDVRNAKVTPVRNGQVFLSEQDSVFTFANDGLKLEKLPITLRHTYEPLYSDDTSFFYATDKQVLSIYNRLCKKTDSIRVSGKSVYPCGNNKFLIVGVAEIVNVAYTSRTKPVVINSLAMREKVVISAFDEHKKVLYFLSNQVLYQYEPLNNHISAIDFFPDVLGITNIFCIRNKIILTTNRKELIIYDSGDPEHPQRISTGIALFGLTQIDEQNYIVNTNKGYYLLRFNKKSNYWPPEKIEYPFQASEVLHLYCKGDNIVCNVNGSLYGFNKRLLNRKLARPVLFIDRISVNGKEYNASDVTIDNVTKCHINLAVSSIYFAGLNSSYEYRIMSGPQQGQWFKNKGEDINIYLPEPGSYKMEVRAITENNIASQTKTLSFHLVPPFYHTVWFLIILIILAIAAMFYGFYLYNRRRRNIYQARLDHMQLEQKAINSLLNPHFIFNVINNIQNLVNKLEHEKANDYLVMMSKLIRQNIENLQFSLIPVDKELQLVTNYIHLQNLRFDGRIKLEISSNFETTEAVQVCPLLIHTFVENAIVHGFKRDLPDFTISIDLSLSMDDYLIITIKDNGVGMANGQANHSHLAQKTSMGIEITKKRLAQISKIHKTNYSIDVTDRTTKGERGTEVTIVIYAKLKSLLV